MPFQQQGHQGLVELAPERPVTVEKQVLDQLLGQGAAALDDASGTQVGQGGAQHRARINTWVPREMAVLHRQKPQQQRLGHFRKSHQDSVLAVRAIK